MKYLIRLGYGFLGLAYYCSLGLLGLTFIALVSLGVYTFLRLAPVWLLVLTSLAIVLLASSYTVGLDIEKIKEARNG